MDCYITVSPPLAVTSIVPKVVPNVSSEAARGIYAESKVKGFGIVVVCVKVSLPLNYAWCTISISLLDSNTVLVF